MQTAPHCALAASSKFKNCMDSKPQTSSFPVFREGV